MPDPIVDDFYTSTVLIDDPHPYFESLRAHGPVYRLPDRNVVAITGFEEAIAVYSDPAHFSSANAVTGPLPDLPFTPEGDDIADQIVHHRGDIPFAREVVGLDAPDHARMRSLLNPLFTPGKLRAMQPGFEAVADSLMDEFAAAGKVEFISGYANPLATLIITELLGVPHEDRPKFRKFFEGGTAGQIGGTVEDIARNPLIEMGMMIARYIAERRQSPREDLLTELALAKYPDGSTPTIEEAARVASFLFGAGQDTTVKLLGTAFRLIGERPELQQQLRDRPELIPVFMEETLRYEGSIKSSHRLCQRTTTVGGVEIKAGTTVMIANIAVNRDPRRYADPTAIDLERPRIKEHLAFGRGMHTCAGAPLARAETKLSIARMLDRFADIRVDETKHGPPAAREFRYEPSYVLRGLETLHLTFRPHD